MDFSAADTELANLALAHLGASKPIADLETENSTEARACRLFYEMARDNTLRDFLWPFARRQAELDLVEEDPTDEWAYSYRYPVDCLYARRLVSGYRVETEFSRLVFEVAGDDGGQLIYSDEEDAVLEYTVKLTNIATAPKDFQITMSFRLASYIAPMVTGGDPYKLGQRALQMYFSECSVARANANNEQRKDQPEDTPYIAAR